MQIDKYFTGRRDAIEASLAYNERGHTPIINIELTNTQTNHRYHLTEKKTYCIQGKKEVNQIEQLKLQIEQLRKEVKIDSQKKDQRITELESSQKNNETQEIMLFQIFKKQIKQQIQEISHQGANSGEKALIQLQIIKKDLKKYEKMIQDSKKETFLLYQEREKVNRVIMRQISEQTERYAEGLQRISRIVEEHSNKIKQIIRLSERSEGQNIRKGIESTILKLIRLKMHQANPHKDSFSVREQSNKLTINKVGKDEWKSYYGSEELEKGKVHFFQIKIIKTKDRSIMIGIGNRNTFGLQNAYYHKQALTYYSQDGAVCQMGSPRSGGSVVHDGSVVNIIVDLSVFTVKWLIDGIYQVTASICAEMRRAPLFLMLQMYCNGDQQQLLT